MNLTDVILIIILLIGAFKGFQEGFILEVVSFLAFFLALYGGFKLLDFGIAWLQPYSDSLGSFVPIAAFILIFLLIIIALNVLARIFKKIIDFTPLGAFDNFAGALLGILKGAIFLSVLNWCFIKMGFDFPHKLSDGSFLYGYIANLGPGLAHILASIFPSLEVLFENVGDFLKGFSK